MKKTFLIFISIFLFLLSSLTEGIAQDAQAAEVSGRIILPVSKKKKRTFRGRLYRNRLSASKKKSTAATTGRTAFQDVVIAAFPLSFKAEVKPMEKARIIQRNAIFIPNVLPVTPGTRVEFINADRFFHNVFSVSAGSKFNIGRRPTNTIVRRTISKTGKINLFCDIHSQMASTIISLNTPYFVTAKRNGDYQLSNLPAGKYRIEVIHPNFDKIVAQLTLSDGESSHQSFTFVQ